MAHKSLCAVLITILVFVLAGAGPASAANNSQDGDWLSQDVVALALLITATVPVDIFAGVGTIGNFTYVVRWQHSPAAWRIIGFISAGATLAVGGVMLGLALNHHDNIGCWTSNFAFWELGIGAVDLGFTIWSSLLPDRAQMSLLLTPTVMPDRNGHAVAGLGLTLVGW